MNGAPGRGARSWWARAGGAVVAVLPQYLVARAIVLGALALAHFIVDRVHPQNAAVLARVHQGLLGWDAGWYKAIAQFGYAPLGHQSLRFFPLLPLLVRALAVLPGVSDGAALLVIANVSALVATTLLYVLVRREWGDVDLARRSVWLLSVVPPAFVLVMGYAEATLLVFVIGCFVAVRPPGGGPVATWRWGAAAGLGFAAALTRPLGALVAFGIAVEMVRWWRGSGAGARVASVVATLAPGAGILVFLGWSQAATGDFWRPLSVQTQSGHHGGLSDPFTTLAHDASGALHHHFGTAVHVPWVLLVLALVVVCFLRLPASYGAFAAAVVVVALSGTNLDSFERYALSAFPLVIAGATLISGVRMGRCVLTLAAAGLGAYALLAFLNLLVP